MTEAKEMNEIVIKDMAGHKIGHWPADMVETIKNTVAKNATHTELELFAQVCNESGLNPFMKEIWFVKYADNEPAIMTGRDGYLKIANMDPNYRGVQAFAVYENDMFKVKISKGKVQDVCHEFSHVNRGVLLGAWAVAEKQGKRPVYTYVKFEDFIQYKKDGQPNKFWRTMPESMIKKVAEADVLKRICGISGLNVAETMPEEYSGDYIDADYSVKEVEDISTPMQTEPEPLPKKSEVDELAETNYKTVKTALKQQNKEINIETVEKKARWFAKNKNHVQFDEDMVGRVMKIAEKELNEDTESENVQEAEFTKKTLKTYEEDMVATEWLEKIKEEMEGKFQPDLSRVKKRCIALIDDEETDFDNVMMERVIAVAELEYPS